MNDEYSKYYLKDVEIDFSGLSTAKKSLKDLAIIQDNEQTDTFSAVPSEYKNNGSCGEVLELGLLGGTGFIFDLWKDEEGQIAVTRAFFSSGSVIEKHIHDVCEIFIIWKGSMDLNYHNEDGTISETTRMGVTDIHKIFPGQRHSAKYLEDTWMIVVTIPAYLFNEDIENAEKD